MKKEESIQKIIPTQELLTEVDSLLVMGGNNGGADPLDRNAIFICGNAKCPTINVGNCVPMCGCPVTNNTTKMDQFTGRKI